MKRSFPQLLLEFVVFLKNWSKVSLLHENKDGVCRFAPRQPLQHCIVGADFIPEIFLMNAGLSHAVSDISAMLMRPANAACGTHDENRIKI